MKCTADVKCHHPGCNATGFYQYDSRKEMIQARPSRDRWVCARHIDPEEVMSPDSLIREKSLVSEESAGHKYWNNCGVIYGPGFKAYADEFPAGTKITITARIEMPRN